MLNRFKLLLCLLSLPLFANERDIEILMESLKTDPENVDSLFHLAESYRNVKQYADAIHWFKTRLEKGGDKDQVWSSKYQLGACYEGLNDWSEALYWYLEAHQMNPSHPDSLLNIATYYRLHSENDLAYIFAKHGSRFTPSRTHRFDEELSIVAFYTRFKEDGYKAASDLLIRKDLSWDTKSQAYRNILFYVQNLKNTHFHPISIDLPLIREGFDERYHPMNPSILKTKDGYQLICRSVNYTQIGAKEFETIDPSGYIRTRNFLIHYTPDFQILSQDEIIEDLPRDRLPFCNVLGLEDPRIFELQGEPWFTCTTRDNTPDGVPQVSLCKLGEQGRVEKLLLLRGPDPYRCEKNWLPFVQDGSLFVIYSYDPFVVYKPDLETGECELDLSYEPTHDFTQFRGSAGPIEFDDGYLILIHEVVQYPDLSRCYLHRFVYLDRRFFVKQISKPFTFLHQGIEYCTSMTLDHEGTHLVMPIGIEDNKAYLCIADLKTIRSLLTPLPPNL